MADQAPSPLAGLIAVLLEQARLLEVLEHRVVTVSVLVSAREARFLTPASDELDRAAAAVADVEERRLQAAATAARALGVNPQGVRLRTLAAVAGGPERATLDALGERLRATTARIEEHVSQAGGVAGMSLGDLRGLLERYATGSQQVRYGASSTFSEPPPPSRFDRRA